MKNIEQIREEANIIYNNKYEYLDIDRSGNKSKILIKCNEHGIFKKYYHDHLLRNQGCPNCSKPSKLDNDSFIKRATITHNNKYDYSKVDYKYNDEKVIITCKIHGDFEQKPYCHLNGNGCYMCCKNHKLNTIEFIEKAKLIHGDKYDYSLTEYINNKTKIKKKLARNSFLHN